MLMRGWLAVLVGCACALAHAVSPVVEEARALMNQGQFAQALERLDRHIASAPQDAEARFTRGVVLARLDRNDDAARAFESLTRDFPELPEPFNNLAVIHAQQGEYDKAREALEDAVAKHPSYAVAHENLGDIHAALSAAAYNRALSLDPSNDALRAKLELVGRLDRLADGGPSTTAPAAAAPAADPAAPDRAAIAQVVRAWAAAWSSKDADAYLAFYAPDFAPEDGASRPAWEAQRRERIARPKQIRVEVGDVRVAPLPGGGVEVSFRQDYRSDAWRNESRKVLEMAQVRGQWRIRREYSR
jgi:tetratricopeptide (TPR) repeat protein